MDLLALKAREEELVKKLRSAEHYATKLFENIAEDLLCVEEDKEHIEECKQKLARLNDERYEGLRELEAVHRVFNDELAAGEARFIDDVKSGKLAAFEVATGKPVTVALFEKR